MIKFSKEKVLLLHQLLAEATGGSIGVRDDGLLDSALEHAMLNRVYFALTLLIADHPDTCTDPPEFV
jgi:prophage maintenance system killer protein